MKHIFSLLGFASLALLLAGCFTAQPVLRLQPEAIENIRWYQGQAVAEKDVDGLVVRAAYSHNDRERLFFDIEIINRTGQDVLVTPEAFELRDQGLLKRQALDPEKLLLGVELEQSRREANAKNTALVVGAVTVAAAVASVATNLSSPNLPTDNGLANTLYTTQAVVDLGATATFVIADVAAQANTLPPPPLAMIPPADQPVFWADYTLRRTTLAPDETVRGLVAFQRIDELPSLLLVTPIDGRTADFVFTQQLFRP